MCFGLSWPLFVCFVSLLIDGASSFRLSLSVTVLLYHAFPPFFPMGKLGLVETMGPRAEPPSSVFPFLFLFL